MTFEIRCKRCGGTGKESDTETFTPWFPTETKPAYKGVYQKLVSGYVRYAYFNGGAWCPWAESVRTVTYVSPGESVPMYQKNVDQYANQPWRGLKEKLS